MLPLLALLLAGCSTPPQTIKTPPDAVYLLDQGDEVNIAAQNTFRRNSQAEWS